MRIVSGETGLLLNVPVPSRVCPVASDRDGKPLGWKACGQSGHTFPLISWLMPLCWSLQYWNWVGCAETNLGLVFPALWLLLQLSVLPLPRPVLQSHGREGACLHLRVSAAGWLVLRQERWGKQARTLKSVTAQWSLGCLSLGLSKWLPVLWGSYLSHSLVLNFS